MEMAEDQELVGNTKKTVREFNQEIKEKSVGQLRNKINLGAHLIQDFEKDVDADPRAAPAIESLQQQIQMLKRELKRRQDQAKIAERKAPEKQQPEETEPFDQTVGLNTLKLKGKTGLG
jgi:predicted phage tail protein